MGNCSALCSGIEGDDDVKDPQKKQIDREKMQAAMNQNEAARV